MERIDIAALVLLLVAAGRGGWLGAIRQIFSISALVFAIAAAKFFGPILGKEAAQLWTDGPGETFLIVALGCTTGLIAAISIGWLGRIIKSWLRAAGLGPADRTAGSLLGLAEGFLIAGLLMWLAVAVVGEEHELLKNTEILRAYEVVKLWIEGN